MKSFRHEQITGGDDRSVDLAASPGTAFGYPRDFFNNRFVYTVVSPRARGLSVGVNMNPDKYCDFDCVYCEVDRKERPSDLRLDVATMAAEVELTLNLVGSGQIRNRPQYQNTPRDLLELRHVTLSGDGEPTLCPNFVEAIEALIHLRACGRFPFFKLVLLTNASGLNRSEVLQGLSLFTLRDEVWAKLEVGTQSYMNRINRPACSLEQILENILQFSRSRPVIIQSLFSSLAGEEPPESEIEMYVQRLRELKEAGAQIPLVQIYSASHVTDPWQCRHLPLETLSQIAKRVRDGCRLDVEVF